MKIQFISLLDFQNLHTPKTRILGLCLDFEDVDEVDEVGEIGGVPASSADIVLVLQRPKPQKSYGWLPDMTN